MELVDVGLFGRQALQEGLPSGERLQGPRRFI